MINKKLVAFILIFLLSINLSWGFAWSDFTSSIETQDRVLRFGYLYNHLVTTMEYDYEKTITKPYIVNVNDVYNSKKGICVDQALVFHYMAHELDIPVRTVFGYKEGSSTYHAWNEVRFKNRVYTVDITFKYFGKGDDYRITKVFKEW